VGHSYPLPTIKLLFATARTCAYPPCATPLVFIDEDHGVREVAVQIAHIRSPKRDGPRHDPTFPADRLNREENLLLLCGVHHHPVDRNSSTYTIGELVEWKGKQLAEGGGYLVHDAEIEDLAARLEAALGELVQATRFQLEVRLVGGMLGLPGQVVCVPLEGLEELRFKGAHLFHAGRLIGVEVENRGPVGAEVRAAGIDIDHGSARPAAWPYSFPANNLTRWQFPCRVEGHSTREWFDDEHSIRRFAGQLFTTRGLVPKRFRAWAALGNGDRLCGDWLAHTDLPIWEPGTGEEQLRAQFGAPG
jgi:hypothetical protein